VRTGHLIPTVVLALIAALAAACGGGGGGSANTAAPPTNAAGTPAATKPAPTPGATKGSGSAKLPADACALLTLEEVQQLIPAAAAGQPKSSSGPVAGDEKRCGWEDTSPISVTNLLPATLEIRGGTRGSGCV